MKSSHLTTPRTLSDCTFVYGYTSSRPMAYRTSSWEHWAGYALAIVIGVSLAAVMVLELSK
jgi:ABC-type nitrate/sulfonate/bicarbonate transport system permease component